MSLHINRFVDSIKAAESRGQKDLIMPIRDAKDLHSDITKLLLVVQNLQQQLQQTNEIVKLEISGGSFKNT